MSDFFNTLKAQTENERDTKYRANAFFVVQSAPFTH